MLWNHGTQENTNNKNTVSKNNFELDMVVVWMDSAGEIAESPHAQRSAVDQIQGHANFPPLKNTSQDTPTSVTRVFFKADFFPKAVGEEGTLLGRFLGSLLASWVSQSLSIRSILLGIKKNLWIYELDIIWYFTNLNFRAFKQTWILIEIV